MEAEMAIQTLRPKLVERKSDLQTILESECWKYGFPISVWQPHWKGPRRITPLTDEDILNKYRSAGFKEVRVEDAYDIEGNPMPEHRAFYYKGDMPTDWLRKTTFTE